MNSNVTGRSIWWKVSFINFNLIFKKKERKKDGVDLIVSDLYSVTNEVLKEIACT